MISLSTVTSISNLNNHSKAKLFQIKSNFNKLGLIIYISSARTSIDHRGYFKSALIELFIKITD